MGRLRSEIVRTVGRLRNETNHINVKDQKRFCFVLICTMLNCIFLTLTDKRSSKQILVTFIISYQLFLEFVGKLLS